MRRGTASGRGREHGPQRCCRWDAIGSGADAPVGSAAEVTVTPLRDDDDSLSRDILNDDGDGQPSFGLAAPTGSSSSRAKAARYGCCHRLRTTPASRGPIVAQREDNGPALTAGSSSRPPEQCEPAHGYRCGEAC